MSALGGMSTITGGITEYVSTGVADDASLSRSHAVHREQWDAVIDGQLVEWGRDPSQLEDEGVIAPERRIIDLASRVALELRDAGSIPPSAVVASGDGGIDFHWEFGDTLALLEVAASGEIEISLFEAGLLRERVSMSRASA